MASDGCSLLNIERMGADLSISLDHRGMLESILVSHSIFLGGFVELSDEGGQT